jgi:prevent-host-death family protein
MITTLSSREFNQDTGSAKKATATGPVVITDRGRPAHVLMTYSEYQRVVGKGKNILDLVGIKGAGDIEFDPAKIQSLSKPIGDFLQCTYLILMLYLSLESRQMGVSINA